MALSLPHFVGIKLELLFISSLSKLLFSAPSKDVTFSP